MKSYGSILELTLQNRKAYRKILDSCTVEQINKIPEGFNNNLYWNAAHILSVQQLFTYRLAGMPYTIPDDRVQAFTKGTKPEKSVDENEVNEIKVQLIETFEQLISDLETKDFSKFKPFMTALKFEINNIDQALLFNQYHEALHMGYMLNIKRFL